MAVVDEAQPVADVDNPWDPSDPSAVQFDDGSWGVAYVRVRDLAYRRGLGNQAPVYWRDEQVVDAGSLNDERDTPSLVRVGSTTALFYRRPVGGVRQVFLSTSTDDGNTWSTPSQLTSEAVSVYYLRALNDGGTVYLFWSLSNTSGLLQYRTSTTLTSWSGTATIGRAIGPWQNNTFPTFDVKRLGSGAWALTWLDPRACGDCQDLQDRLNANSYWYPAVWFATSPDLGATAWSDQQPLTLPYSEKGSRGASLAQAPAGTIFISFHHKVYYGWDSYGHYRTSGDGGASWSTKTTYAYEPARPTDSWSQVVGGSSELVVDNGGGVRAFWDQYTQTTGSYTDSYPVMLFYRDLPNGTVMPIPATRDELSQCGPCVKTAAYAADPVNVATANFTLPETDVVIPTRGPALTFQRTYNSARLADGPLGVGWTHAYDTRLISHPRGEVLIVDGSGRSDLYTPAVGGGYTPPAGQFATLVHNGDGTWTLTERSFARKTFSSTGRLTAIADRNGNALALTYDGAGLLASVADPAGRTLGFAYSGQRISTVTDPMGRTVQFGYGSAGDLTSVIDMRGKTWAYTYDAAHRMLTKVDPNHHTVLTNAYGSLGRVISQRDAKSGETRFAYADNGGTMTTTHPRGNTTTYAFDTQYRISSVTDTLGGVVSYTYDAANNVTRFRDVRRGSWVDTTFTYDARGNTLTRTNAQSKVWTYTYNAFNDVLTATDPLNRTSTFAYDGAGNLSSVTNAKNETTTFARNGYGQATSVTDARSKTSTFGYDGYGNQTTVTNPYGKSWTTSYDLAGRKTAVADPLTHTTSIAYDPNGNVLTMTDGRGKVTTYAYDDANNRTTATDPNLKVTRFAYDETNRLTTVTDAANGVTTYAYDANDNRVSATDANNHTRTWTYDKADRVVTETDALGNQTRFEYDGAGNRTKRAGGNGAVVYAYDTLNRLTSASFPSGTITHGYDAANRRTTMTDGTGTTTYGYDELDRLASVTMPGARTVAYQYDPAGNRSRITYPDGKTVDYVHDDANRLVAVTDWLTKTTSYAYDDAGRLISTTFPTGVVETRGYTDADQLTSILAAKGGATLTSFAYTLDDAGLRTAVQDTFGTETYTYDDLYRLTGVTYFQGSTQSFTYDAVGNRLTQVTDGITTTYGYDTADRLTAVGATTYANDEAGNRTAAGGRAYCYDALNRLTSASDQPPCPALANPPTRVNAGGTTPYTSGGGQVWEADNGFSGGGTSSTSATIANTTDQKLYQTDRNGTSFSYGLDVPSGTYTVTLKFAENTKTAAGQRIFDVAINGTTVLSNFDIFAAAGGKNIAVDRTFTATATNGRINVAFTASVAKAKVSAIELVPVAGPSGGPPLVSYSYRGNGLRHARTAGGVTTTYTWDVGAALPVVLQDGTSTYVYGLGGALIGQTDAAGVQTYLLADGLGSTAAQTDASGTVTATLTYEPFGLFWTGTGTPATEYRFTGQQDDPALGFQYVRARYYDPTTGRFISQDPFCGVATNPQTLHRYAYVRNNPANLVDPTGLFPGEDLVERVFNALANPAFAPDEDGRSADLAGLIVRSEACGTGSALPALAATEDAIMVAGTLIPGLRVVSAAVSLERLSAAARVADRAGLTVAGRSLVKHASRAGSRLPKPTGNPRAINDAAHELVDDVLTTPGNSTVTRQTGRFGQVIEVTRPDGIGARFSANGDFIHFVE